MFQLFKEVFQLPKEMCIWHHDAKKAQFELEIEKVEELCKTSDDKILLLFHFAGHGHANGGYIALFDNKHVNLNAEFNNLSAQYSNLYIINIFDACSTPEEV